MIVIIMVEDFFKQKIMMKKFQFSWGKSMVFLQLK